MKDRFCIVRTYSAGVHCGVVVNVDGKNVQLTDARRIWRWRGANSLHEVALHGAAQEYTRISEPVPEILLTEAVEVIPCTAKARENLSVSRWAP